MVFSGLTFLIVFLPITILLYYLLPLKGKNVLLLFASLIFYSWGEPIYILLMLYSILFNYTFGLLLARFREHKKEILIFTLCMNLAILGFFKYAHFVLDTTNAVIGTDFTLKNIALPVGISFYTFQALSYIIDLYRERFRPQKDPIAFAAYITMFPQLIAGPIVRYEDIEADLTTRKTSLVSFGLGARRFIFGLSKKVLLANYAGSLYEEIAGLGGNLSVLSAWLGAVAYTFQIFFDFSGYSDMAIGLGMMLGFHFQENFDYPYFSKSVTEFWRKWHISLSSWFREYVYIPLGGNRVSVGRHIINLLIVWFLTGLWHGASWNFVLWGLYYWLLLVFEKYVLSRISFLSKWKVLPRLYTALCFIIGWVIFSHTKLQEVGTTLAAMFAAAPCGLYDQTGLYYLTGNIRLLLCCLFFSLPCVRFLHNKLAASNFGQICINIIALALFLLSLAVVATENYNPFLYFRF